MIAQRLLRIPIGSKYIDRIAFNQIANYGGVTFIIIVAGRLRFKSDAVIIGTFLSTTAITYFSIGARLVDYGSDVLNSMAQIFTPMSSQFHSVGDDERLGKIFIAGNRACAFIMFPIAVSLFVMGKSVIEAWMGPRYVSSYVVLLIILFPSALYYAQTGSNRILFGTGQHKALAYVALIEGTANLILSIALVRPLGIVGDAIGTAIPLLCTALIFLPRHMCRLLHFPLRRFLTEAYLYPAVLCVPMGLALHLMQQFSYAHRYPQLLLNLTAGWAVYGVGVLWFVLTREPMGIQFRGTVIRYLASMRQP
jgi:O-antigen/teichoic acid export membrane protein